MALSDVDESSSDSTPKRTENRPRKRRLLRWVLVGIGATLVIGLIILNGPGFRAIGRYAAREYLNTLGLEGDLKIAGSITGGFSISEVEFKGTAPPDAPELPTIHHLKLNLAEVDYRFFDLLTSATSLTWLDLVKVEGLSLDLTLPDPEASQKTEKAPAGITPARDGYSPLWGLLSATISLTEIDLSIRDANGKATSVKGVTFRLPASGPGEIGFDQLTLPDRAPNEAIRIPVSHGNRELSLGPIPVTDAVEVRTIQVAEPRPTVFTALLETSLNGGILTAVLTESEDISIAMRDETAIDLSGISPELPLAGRITDLDFQFLNPFSTPDQWALNGQLTASGLGYEDFSIDAATLTAQDQALTLEASRSDLRFLAAVSAPLSRATSTELLETLPIDLALDVDIPQLQPLLSALKVDVPLDGHFKVQTRNIQFDLEGDFRAGALLAEADRLVFDGLHCETLQIAANVEKPNRITLAADVGVDLENTVRVTGAFDCDDLTYNAEGGIEASLGQKLQNWLRSKEAPNLAGSLSGAFKGSGSLATDAASHSGSAQLSLSSFTINDAAPIQAQLSANYQDSSAKIETLELSTEAWKLSGSADWDGKLVRLDDFRISETGKSYTPLSLNASLPFEPSAEVPFLEQETPVHLELKLDRLDLDQILSITTNEPPVKGELSGSLNGFGTLSSLALKSNLAFYPELAKAGADSHLNVDLDFSGNPTLPETWDTTIDAALDGLQWKELKLGSVNLKVVTDPNPTASPGIGSGKQLKATFDFEHAETTVNATSYVQLGGAETISELAEQSIGVNALIDIPDLAAIWRDFAPENMNEYPVEGTLSFQFVDFRMQRGELVKGNTSLKEGASLKLGGEPFSLLRLDTATIEPNSHVIHLGIAADEHSEIKLDAFYNFNSQVFDVEADIQLDLENDGTLKRLLGDRHIASLLPAKSSISGWAKGDASNMEAEGSIEANLERLSLGSGAAPISANITADFTENSLTSMLNIESDPIDLNGELDWNGEFVTLGNLTGNAGGRDVLSASGTIPLQADKLAVEDWLNSPDPIDLNLKTDGLKLSTIFALLMEKSPVTGVLDTSLSISDRLADPTVNLDTELSQIVVPGKNPIAVGDLSLSLKAAAQKANLNGTFKHPKINPLNITAAVPFRPASWMTGEVDPANEPVSLTAKMARSSLGFLAEEFPGIQIVKGTLGFDAKIGGTFSKPTVSGSGGLEMSQLRLNNRNAPSFYDIDLATSFSENKISIDRLRAIVAGGEVNGGGAFTFGPEQEPAISFRLTGTDVLLARSPDLSLRSNLNITLDGPWSRARLAGDIGITNSRFFKNFDLLPTALPRRNTSALPTVERTPGGGGAAYTDLDIGVPVEPFNAWPVELRLHTIDPFQIRTNLVESDLAADINLLGTLGEPYPVGKLELAGGALSLPFSSIDVEIGQVKFDQNTGFNGTLELRARAKADSYRINIFLFNRIFSPQYVLTSVPPLPSEDLLTLIITGTTRDELVSGGGASLAAGKAATLLFKNMRKVSAAADREPTFLDEMQERTELEIGGVNPETGEHTVGGKIRLWKQLFFVGDVDAQSDYRATLKYIFRFR